MFDKIVATTAFFFSLPDFFHSVAIIAKSASPSTIFPVSSITIILSASPSRAIPMSAL